MDKLRSKSDELLFGSIRSIPLVTVLPDATKNEINEIPVISIEGLRGIARIVRAIEERIAAREGVRPGNDIQPGLAGNPGSAEITGENSGENNIREGSENK